MSLVNVLGAAYTGGGYLMGTVAAIQVTAAAAEKLHRYLGGAPKWPLFQGDCAREEFQASSLCNPALVIPEYVVFAVAGVQFTITLVRALKSALPPAPKEE